MTRWLAAVDDGTIGWCGNPERAARTGRNADPKSRIFAKISLSFSTWPKPERQSRTERAQQIRKRQKTAALQNLAEVSCSSASAAAFWSAASAVNDHLKLEGLTLFFVSERMSQRLGKVSRRR